MNNNTSSIDYYTELKTSRFEDLKALVHGLKAISAELQKLCYWKFPPLGAVGLYGAIKKVTKPIYQLFNYRGNSAKALRQIKEAIVYLNVLIRESIRDEVVKFKEQLQRLEQLAISLLPKDEGVQLTLFDDEVFTTYNRQPRVFKIFSEWLENLKYRFCEKPNIGSRVEVKAVKVQQLSICFGA